MNKVCRQDRGNQNAPEKYVHTDSRIRSIENHETDILMEQVEGISYRANRNPADSAKNSCAPQRNQNHHSKKCSDDPRNDVGTHGNTVLPLKIRQRAHRLEHRKRPRESNYQEPRNRWPI